MTYNTVKITSHRISINFNTIDQPKLSKLAGKIVSTKFRICDIIHLKTRFIYITMENRFSWDSTFNLAHQIKTAKEILFFKNVTKKLHKRVIKDYNVFILMQVDFSWFFDIPGDLGHFNLSFRPL